MAIASKPSTGSRGRPATVCCGLLSVAAILIGDAAGAQDQPTAKRLEPDRRDFTTGTGIVPTGLVQVEGGATWEGDGDGSRRYTLGDITIRVPVAREVEVHLGLPPYLIERAFDRRTGFDDALFEVRYRFLRSRTVDVGVQFSTMLPTGSRSVAERRFQPGVTLAASRTLSDRAELVFSATATRAVSDGIGFAQYEVASSFRFDVTERINAFVEAYVLNRDERGGAARRHAAAGLVWFVDRDLALDARIGGGPNNGSDTRSLASVGVSRRF